MKRFFVFLLFSSALVANAQLRAIGTAKGHQCVSNLKQIGIGLVLFEQDHGTPPAKLEDAAAEYSLKNVLSCPDAKKTYIYLGPSKSPNMPVVMDRLGNHPNEVNVLFGDGHVAKVRHTSTRYKGLTGCFRGLSDQERKTLSEIFRKLDSGK